VYIIYYILYYTKEKNDNTDGGTEMGNNGTTGAPISGLARWRMARAL